MVVVVVVTADVGNSRLRLRSHQSSRSFRKVNTENCRQALTLTRYAAELPFAIIGHVEINELHASLTPLSQGLALFSKKSDVPTSLPERADVTPCPVLPVPVTARLQALDVLVAVVADEHVDASRLPLRQRCSVGSYWVT